MPRKPTGEVAMTRTNIHLPDKLWEAARIFGVKTSQSGADVVRTALREYLEREVAKRKAAKRE